MLVLAKISFLTIFPIFAMEISYIKMYCWADFRPRIFFTNSIAAICFSLKLVICMRLATKYEKINLFRRRPFLTLNARSPLSQKYYQMPWSSSSRVNTDLNCSLKMLALACVSLCRKPSLFSCKFLALALYNLLDFLEFSLLSLLTASCKSD